MWNVPWNSITYTTKTILLRACVILSSCCAIKCGLLSFLSTNKWCYRFSAIAQVVKVHVNVKNRSDLSNLQMITIASWLFCCSSYLPWDYPEMMAICDIIWKTEWILILLYTNSRTPTHRFFENNSIVL